MSLETNKIVDFDLPDTDMIFDCQFYPARNDWIAFATIEGNIKMLNFSIESRDVVMDFPMHHKGSPIRKVRFLDNLMFSAAKTVKITDLNNGKLVRKIDNNKTKISSLLVADNYLVCVGDDEGNFTVWDYRDKRPAHMQLKQCEEYISDLDLDAEGRLVAASSGEGTLTAFNIRARRMEDPQSELFETGFQCVRFMSGKDKVVVGTEDGALNIFNNNEWGNISDRFPVQFNLDGKASIDHMEVLHEEHNALVIGLSDGSLRALSLFPHQELKTLTTFPGEVESLDVHQILKKVVCTSDSKVQIFSYEFSKEEKQTKHKVKKQKTDGGFFAGLAS